MTTRGSLSRREAVSCTLLAAAVLLFLIITPNKQTADAFLVPPTTRHSLGALVSFSQQATIRKQQHDVFECHATKQPQRRRTSKRRRRRRNDGITEEDDAAFGAWLEEQSKKVSDPNFDRHRHRTGSSTGSHHHQDELEDHSFEQPFVKLPDASAQQQQQQQHHEPHQQQNHHQQQNNHRVEGAAKTSDAVEDTIEDAIKISASSFKFMEGKTQSLLQDNPIVALGIFAVLGLIGAYIIGFFFLEGYISSPNPYENGAVPYFEDVPDETLLQLDPSSVTDAVDSITSDLNL